MWEQPNECRGEMYLTFHRTQYMKMSPTIKFLKENRTSSGHGGYQRFLASSKSPVKFDFITIKYPCLSWT